MKERVLKTLEAYLITNMDVLEADDIKDIEEQIEAVKDYKESILKRLIRYFKETVWKISK